MKNKSCDTAPRYIGDVVSPLLLGTDSERQLCLVVRYDGTDYHGFQRQINASTVQGELERILRGCFGAGDVIGASRTDAGVHAEHQMAVWTGRVSVPNERILLVLNRRLPPAIQIVRVGFSPVGWDPRRAACIKRYRYRIWRAEDPPPIEWYRFVYWTEQPLTWHQLNADATKFLGLHDFRAFRTEGSGAATTTRYITESRWTMEADGRMWQYQVAGDGFLYRMVRHMVGAMLKASTGDTRSRLIDRGLREPQVKVTPLAPACGLTLECIDFREEEVHYVSRSRAGVGE